MRFLSYLKNKLGFSNMKNNNLWSDDGELQKPEFTPTFIKFIEKSHEHLTHLQNKLIEDYCIGSYERWFYDQKTGLITFYDGDIPKLEIVYEQVGSISKSTKTWLWAWDNPYLEEKIKSEIGIIREYGIENNFEPLIKRKWYGDEIDGWEMTAISTLLMKAKGAYKIPTKKTYSFIVFKEIIDLREEN